MLFTTETRTVDIDSDGKTYHVTLRKFNEGQRLARVSIASRLMQLEVGEAGIVEQLWLFDYETAIANWDFPRELSLEAIRELDPDVGGAIHDVIVEMNPSVWPPEDDDEDPLDEAAEITD